MTKTHIINGVDTEKLFGTVDAIKEMPSLASFNFRATNKWISGGHNRSMIKDFYGAGQEDTSRRAPFVVDNDEPAVLLGEDNGANPVEYLLHGLAGCLTSSLVYHAAAQGIKLDEVESTLDGDIDLRGFLNFPDGIRSGYQNIRVTFKIKSGAPREKIEELVRLARQVSPVCNTLTQGVTVDVKLAESATNAA
ncbi:MAG: OsmC family protein [Acidobacteriota bacterium]|nr:MAG: OsmC family protein [Acidobacteriota bacterium]